MASTYKQIVQQQMNLMKELNNLDYLLPKNDEDKYHYPQLFKDDQQSLFQPDQCFDTEKCQEKLLSKLNKKQLPKFGLKKSKDIEIFEEYLDSLEINQFIQKQSTKSFHNKDKDKNSLECTFKPSILKKSCSIANNLKPSFDRLTSSISVKKHKTPYKAIEKDQNKKLYSKERIEKLSKPRPLKTEPTEDKEEPSFKPNLNKKSLEQMSSCFYDVATRNELWLKQKQAKVQKLRGEEEERKNVKEENSYTPKINSYKGQKGAMLSKFNKQGIAGYFERLNNAKQRNSHIPKANDKSGRDSMIGGYSSKKIEKENNKTSQRQIRKEPKQKENTDTWNNKKINEPNRMKKKYKDAVQELHEKIMKLKI